MRRHLAPSLVALALVVVTPACQSPTTAERGPDRGEEAPRAMRESQFWETRAAREIEVAGQADELTIKQKHYDAALEHLKHARSLYEDELQVGAPTMPAPRRANLESEIDRLTRAIEKTTRDRPAAHR